MTRPTKEQEEAVERFLTGAPLKIAAFAGAGKTTTLKMLAEAAGSARGTYVAFNRAVAAEAKQKFPRTVDCRTTHALAFRSVKPRYDSTNKMTGSFNARQLAHVIGYGTRLFPGAFRLDGVHQAHLVLGTVRRFCQSADDAISLEHVPRYGRLLGATRDVVAEIRSWSVAQSEMLWRRMTDKKDEIPLGHNGYLKLWALSHPRIASDYILLDEAQDTNAAVLGILAGQRAQVVYVGDKYQQIYEWRGAVNAMEKIAGCEEAALTQSFRFGSAIAAEASKVLATLGETRRILGNPEITSQICPSGEARAVLARTNATVIHELLEALNDGQTSCICGGTQDIERLLNDVGQLKAGRPVTSPDFFGFTQWREVLEFSATEEGRYLRPFVSLVQQHGERKLLAAVGQAVDDETEADIVISTAHRAKGREFERVRLSSDFASSRSNPEADADEEARLFYVAMTRAKRMLIAEPGLLRVFTAELLRPSQTEDAPAQTGDLAVSDFIRSAHLARTGDQLPPIAGRQVRHDRARPAQPATALLLPSWPAPPNHQADLSRRDSSPVSVRATAIDTAPSPEDDSEISGDTRPSKFRRWLAQILPGAEKRHADDS